MKCTRRNQDIDKNAYNRRPSLQGRHVRKQFIESQRRAWHPRFGLSLLIILGFLFQSVSMGVGGLAPGPDPLAKSDADCDLHPPIRIIGIGNQDSSPIGFGSPLSGVRSGSGTEDDPYIIEGWCIHLSADGSSSSSDLDGMHLEHTSSHVIIRNNQIINPLPESRDRAGVGIYLEHVDNVTIENNTFEFNWRGIDSWNRAWIVRNVDILNNTITGSDSWGINLRGSSGFVVNGNVVMYGGSGGIRESGSSFFPSQSNIISNNMVAENEGYDSIWVLRNNNTRIENNTMTENSERGLLIEQSSGVAVRRNEISGHQTGVIVHRSNATEVWGNEFHNNTEVGFRVSQSKPSLVSHNMIHGNGIGMEADGSSRVNATMNWWGCPEGPGHDACNRIEGNVTYDPWLLTPDGGLRSSFEENPESNTASAPTLMVLLPVGTVLVMIRRK